MSVVFHTRTNKGEEVKVSHAIKLLSEINPDEEIAISWWEANLFTDEHDETLSADSEGWLRAVADFTSADGYATINSQMWDFLWYSITEQGEF
jgi:uncharacterized damage-inducible protein DinB